MAERRFRKTFEQALRGTSIFAESRGMTFDSIQKQARLGHPEFENLGFQQTRESKIVVLFLDIRGFTKLSFAKNNEELLRILQAMTEASIAAISENGGYVGEFTGDGVLAYFGGSHMSDEEAAFAALRTASGLMFDVKDYVNPMLSRNGSDPIRIGIGLEYGPVLWSRIGVYSSSQVKAISDVTFLAGKLSTSKYTNAWECKIGERLAYWLEDSFKTKAKAYTFQLDGRQISHDLYLFDWQAFFHEDTRQPQFRRRLLEKRIGMPNVIAATTVGSPQQAPPAAVRLKDQPFF